jgi:hypothetical protein
MAGVNLRVATLKNANLQNCDLRAAVLAGADLEVCISFLSLAIAFPLFHSSSFLPSPLLFYPSLYLLCPRHLHFIKNYGFCYYHICVCPSSKIFSTVGLSWANAILPEFTPYIYKGCSKRFAPFFSAINKNRKVQF